MKRSHVVPVILLSKSVVGASAVAFPRYFAVLGAPLGLAMLSLLAAATVMSTEVVLEAMHESSSGSYAGAVRETLGGRGGGRARGRSESGGEGGDGETERGGATEAAAGHRHRRSLDLRLRRSLPSLALEASGTAFAFGLLVIYNIVVADLAVGERGAKAGSGGGGLLCPPLAAGGFSDPPLRFSSSPFFCSRPRFSLLLNALVLIPLSLRRAARDSKVPSAVGIFSLLAWAAATAALCFCAWLGGTLSSPSDVPDWRAIAAGSGGGGGGGSSGNGSGVVTPMAATTTSIITTAAPPPPQTPPPLLACLVGLARAAGLPTSGLVCQLTAPFVVGAVNRHSPREAALIVREAGVLSASVYALLGVGAGALFGSRNVQANVLSNWQPEALAATVPWLFGGEREAGGREPGESPFGAAAAAATAAAAAPPSSLASRLLSNFVGLSVAASLVTMYPLLMFPCRDGALILWRRAFGREERRRREEEEEEESGGDATEEQLLPEGGREGDDEEQQQQRRATPTNASTTAAPRGETAPSTASHALSTLLLASAAALAALSSGDSAFDVLRLTGATAGATVSYVLPAGIAAAQRRAGVAVSLAVVGAVMIGTAF